MAKDISKLEKVEQQFEDRKHKSVMLRTQSINEILDPLNDQLYEESEESPVKPSKPKARKCAPNSLQKKVKLQSDHHPSLVYEPPERKKHSRDLSLLSLGQILVKLGGDDAIAPHFLTFDEDRQLHFPARLFEQLEIDAEDTQPLQQSIQALRSMMQQPDFAYLTGWLYLPELHEAGKIYRLGQTLKLRQESIQLTFHDSLFGLCLMHNNQQSQKLFDSHTKWILFNDYIK